MKTSLYIVLVMLTLCLISCARRSGSGPDGLAAIQTPEQALRVARQALESLDPPITGVMHRIVREIPSAFVVEYPSLFADTSASQHTEIVVNKFKPKVELLPRVPGEFSSDAQEELPGHK